MRAAVYHGAHDVRIEERAASRARRRARCCCRVLRSGMCGTDATEWKAGPLTFPVRPAHPVTGHDGPDGARARVRRRGRRGRRRARRVPVGDRGRQRRRGLLRAVRPVPARAAPTSAAATTRSASTPPAAWPSSSRCRSRRSSPVPDGLSLDAAGLAQPLAVGLHAARRVRRPRRRPRRAHRRGRDRHVRAHRPAVTSPTST